MKNYVLPLVENLYSIMRKITFISEKKKIFFIQVLHILTGNLQSPGTYIF